MKSRIRIRTKRSGSAILAPVMHKENNILLLLYREQARYYFALENNSEEWLLKTHIMHLPAICQLSL